MGASVNSPGDKPTIVSVDKLHGAESPSEASAPKQARRSGTLFPVLLLIAGDVLVLEAGIVVGTLVRSALDLWFPISIGPSVFVGANIALLALPLCYAVAGLYPGYGKTAVERLRLRVTVTALMFALLMLLDHLSNEVDWSRGILLGAAVFSVAVIPLWDSLARSLLIRFKFWGMPVVALGPAAPRTQLVHALQEHPTIGWNCVYQGELTEAVPHPFPGAALAIVIAPIDSQATAITDFLPYRRVVLVPGLDEMQALWVTARDMGPHLGLEIQRNLLVPANRTLKRAMDLLISSVCLVAASPIIAIAAVAITISSPGASPFYRQRRLGEGGRPLDMIKLRTMVPNAEESLEALLAASPAAKDEWLRTMKLRQDPRIIPGVGHFLRRFSIDEMPQFWNVLRGDMSLVGPRPLPDYHVRAFGQAANDLRQKVRPGITGLCQISGRSTRNLSEQQRLDSYYVRNWSLWLDLHILGRTVIEVIVGKGAW